MFVDSETDSQHVHGLGSDFLNIVIAGLDPAIHAMVQQASAVQISRDACTPGYRMDSRVKHGNDDVASGPSL